MLTFSVFPVTIATAGFRENVCIGATLSVKVCRDDRDGGPIVVTSALEWGPHEGHLFKARMVLFLKDQFIILFWTDTRFARFVCLCGCMCACVCVCPV